MIESDDRDAVSAADRPLPGTVSRYDLLLAAVPGAFVLALVAGRTLSLPPHLTIIAGATIAALAIGDGLFRNPPGTGRTTP